MPTKARGPLQTDYQRLIRACRREGVPKFKYHFGGVTIVIPLDDAYIAKMALGHPPVPDFEPEEEIKPDW